MFWRTDHFADPPVEAQRRWCQVTIEEAGPRVGFRRVAVARRTAQGEWRLRTEDGVTATESRMSSDIRVLAWSPLQTPLGHEKNDDFSQTEQRLLGLQQRLFDLREDLVTVSEGDAVLPRKIQMAVDVLRVHIAERIDTILDEA